MAPRTPPNPSDRRLWQLARGQHGVVSKRQLLDAGLSAEAIKHRLRTGRLRQIHRGIYVAGQLRLTRHGRWMAAVLACRGAVLSHLSAAALFRILDRDPRVVHVSLQRAGSCSHPGIKTHRPRCLPPDDIGVFEGIPVTSPTRTLIDLAGQLRSDRLERAVNEALIRDLVDLEALRGELERRRGQRGVRPLRAMIDRHTFALTRSELERAFLPIAQRAGLPRPRTQARVNGFEVDFFWPELGLVVETDGGRFHRSAMKQTRDRRREHAHIEAGLLPVRFTHWQVRHDPGGTEATLTSAAERCRRERRAAA